jgi:hypothetical protein
MFQGIRGHKVGRHRSWFDLWSLLLLCDWALYVLGLPALVALAVWHRWFSIELLMISVVGNVVWTVPAALALRKWRLIPLTPALILIDVVYRAVFVHAFVKACREPRVTACRWVSPARY